MASNKLPWSGSYWPTGYDPMPMAEDDGPLDKFDQYIKWLKNEDPGSKEWEKKYHRGQMPPKKTDLGCGWCGHCHGWSAAAILETEPTEPSTIMILGKTFSVGDLKGLLTEVHCWDHSRLLAGSRDTVTWSKDDVLQAHKVHQVLVDYVQNGVPVVMDLNKTSHVWNYPVYKCQMTSQPDQNDPSKTHVTCKLWYAGDFADDVDYVGTQELSQTYKYWIRGDFKNPSDGDWEDSSQNDHPGFIWRPEYVDTNAQGANPVVKYYAYIEALIWLKPALLIAIPELAEEVIIRRIIPDYPPPSLINPLLYRGLVARDAFSGYAVPMMASSWERSDDGLSYMFHMRERATFHDGAPVTARDVAFTYKAMMEPDLDSPYRGELMEVLASVDVVDELTVAIRLRQPLTDFPALHGWHWILPRHVVEEIGWEQFTAHPVGSGPFAFSVYEPGHHLTLAAYPDYCLGRPSLDRIVILEVPDVDRRLELLLEGRADIALFEHTLELERRGQEMSDSRTFLIPADTRRRLEIQSVRVRGRIPNLFDGAWNATHWSIDPAAPGPAPMAPAGSLRHRLTREGKEKRMNSGETGRRFPEWHEGTWWQIQVRQTAIAAMAPEPGWTLPLHMVFEIIGEEMVEDRACYRIRVTYPDRPRSAEYQYAEIWVSRDERMPVRGRLQIGDRSVPMHDDFVMELLKTISGAVDAEGQPRAMLDPRWPEEKVELKAFETRTPAGGSRLSSLAAPFPLRIDEPDYIVELQDWGG